MNVKHIIAIATLTITSGAVFADAPYPVEQPFVSTKTRAQVGAELADARAQGLIGYGNNYPIIKSAPGTKTRAEVVAELADARAQGQIGYGNDYPVTKSAAAQEARVQVANGS